MGHLTCHTSLDVISDSWPFSSKWQIDRLGLMVVSVGVTFVGLLGYVNEVVLRFQPNRTPQIFVSMFIGSMYYVLKYLLLCL